MKKKIAILLALLVVSALVALCTSCTTSKNTACTTPSHSQSGTYSYSDIKPSQTTPVRGNYKPRYK
ncbi:hypothetical protein FACS1894178_8540 [Bacteroidia bacterium]|nr:hypothetical protein FACS1894178_8540 [Bacteroidia bacterium]